MTTDAKDKSKNFQEGVSELLWESLARDPDHSDLRLTGWGYKTKQGLAACVADLLCRTSDEARPHHTPGNWRHVGHKIIGPNNELVASIGAAASPQAAQANGCLIRTSPRLLLALEATIPILAHRHYHGNDANDSVLDIYDIASVAIKEAVTQ